MIPALGGLAMKALPAVGGAAVSHFAANKGNDKDVEQQGFGQIYEQSQAGGENKEKSNEVGGRAQTLMAGAAGAFGGAVSKWKETEGSTSDKLREAAKGALIGGGAGALTKMSYDAIQEEGGGLKAGITSAGAAALTSTLKEGGPGIGKSALGGFASAYGTDFAHDKLTASGHAGMADALSGAGVGAGLGYAYDGAQTGLAGAAGGAAFGGLDSMIGGSNGTGFGIDTNGPQAMGVSGGNPFAPNGVDMNNPFANEKNPFAEKDDKGGFELG